MSRDEEDLSAESRQLQPYMKQNERILIWVTNDGKLPKNNYTKNH